MQPSTARRVSLWQFQAPPERRNESLRCLRILRGCLPCCQTDRRAYGGRCSGNRNRTRQPGAAIRHGERDRSGYNPASSSLIPLPSLLSSPPRPRPPRELHHVVDDGPIRWPITAPVVCIGLEFHKITSPEFPEHPSAAIRNSNSSYRTPYASLTHICRTQQNSEPYSILTSVAWARDEPPSPLDDGPASASKEYLSDHTRPSADIASFQSSLPDDNAAGPSRWWAFTRHRPDLSLTSALSRRQQSTDDELTLRGSHSRDRSKSLGWPRLGASLSRRSQDESTFPSRTNEAKDSPRTIKRANTPNFHIDLPPPEPVMTLAHNMTPGWDSPWTPRPPADLVSRIRSNGNGTIHEEETDSREEGHEKLGTWARRRKKYRIFMLTNVYVPLVSAYQFPILHVRHSYDGGVVVPIRQHHLYNCGFSHGHQNPGS